METIEEKSYLHGYTETEQDRLYQQAAFLRETIFETVDFQAQNHILEVGCGVGAQTENLLARFPHLKIRGVDRSRSQLERARQRLEGAVKAGRVVFDEADAGKLPYPLASFDGAFLCWFLEHVEAPVEILREVRRVLKPRSPIYCREVFNASLFLSPRCPLTMKYWEAFNDHQAELGGDPRVGVRLGNLLTHAGFKSVVTEPKPFLFDSRSPEKRSQLVDIWINLLLSAATSLVEAGRVTPELAEGMKDELTRWKGESDGVFFYTSIQAMARVS